MLHDKVKKSHTHRLRRINYLDQAHHTSLISWLRPVTSPLLLFSHHPLFRPISLSRSVLEVSSTGLSLITSHVQRQEWQKQARSSTRQTRNVRPSRHGVGNPQPSTAEPVDETATNETRRRLACVYLCRRGVWSARMERTAALGQAEGVGAAERSAADEGLSKAEGQAEGGISAELE